MDKVKFHVIFLAFLTLLPFVYNTVIKISNQEDEMVWMDDFGTEEETEEKEGKDIDEKSEIEDFIPHYHYCFFVPLDKSLIGFERLNPHSSISLEIWTPPPMFS